MWQRHFHFTLRELVLFVSLLPLGIGFVAACNLWMTYVELFELGDPLRHTRDRLLDWYATTNSQLSKVLYFVAGTALDQLFEWSVLTIAIAAYAFPKWRASRLFGVLLIIAAPIVETLFTWFVPSDHRSGILSAPVIAKCICYILVTLLFLLIWFVVCQFRPISAQTDLQRSRRQHVYSAAWKFILIVFTLAMAVEGWKGLQYYIEMGG
jgi:hypothetical protein